MKHILISTIKILLIILIFSSISCKQEKVKEKEKEIEKQTVSWDSIRNSTDFISFLEFALSPSDTSLLKQCYDSLTKYMPERVCENLVYYSKTDTITEHGFFLSDTECEWGYHGSGREEIEIGICSEDMTFTDYKRKTDRDYKELLFLIHSGKLEKELLPRSVELTYNKKGYTLRLVDIKIRCKMLPKSSEKKTSWGKLVNVLKELSGIIKDIKKLKAATIFNRHYDNLKYEEKVLINRLVSPKFTIKFGLSPPAPPPIKIKD